MSKKYMIHITAVTDEEVKKELIECANILTGLRDIEINTTGQFGSKAKEKVKYWRGLADAWIQKHKVYYNDDDNAKPS